MLYEGTFEVTSNKIFVGDPCYGPTGDSDNELTNSISVDNGTWFYTINSVNNTIHDIYLGHIDSDDEDLEFDFAENDLGVDAGLMSLFDSEYYSACYSRWENHTSWCAEVVDPFCRTKRGFIQYPQGVICSSGYGDGIYLCQIGRDKNGNIKAIGIVFVMEDD